MFAIDAKNRNIGIGIGRIKMTTVETISENHNGRFSMAMFQISNDKGPVLRFIDNFGSDNEDHQDHLIYSGMVLTFTLGQGHGYNEGLYGPFPYGDPNYLCLAFSGFLENKLQENEYYVIAFYFPKELKVILKYYPEIEQTFDNQLAKLKLIDELDESFLSDLKNEILRIIK